MFNLPQDLPKLKIPDQTRHVTEFGWLITTEAAGYLTVKPRTLLLGFDKAKFVPMHFRG